MMNIGIIGLGLMGSSLALAINKYCQDIIIYGNDKNRGNLDYVLANNIIADVLNIDRLSRLDILFLAVPVRASIEVLEEIRPYLNAERTLITDLGSTKSYICREMKERFPDLKFIGGHPMTGRETSGPDTADEDLFLNKSYLLINEPALKREGKILIEILEKIGARIIFIDSERHDDLVALTSHLPHLIAIALMNEVIKYEEEFPEISKLMGQGFRDFTRIAASSPVVWRDIFLTNREFIIDKIDRIINTLLFFKTSLLQEEEGELKGIMEAARKKRTLLQKELWEEANNVL